MDSERMSKIDRPFGLPISNGKLAMGLFLSTEVMFFTALVGTYIVLRQGTSAEGWPSPAQVHSSLAVGAVSTAVLIFSSLTMILSSKNGRLGRPLRSNAWGVVTILLGAAYLGVTGFDYAVKYSHGVTPGIGRSRIYDRADLNYLVAVKRATQQRMTSVSEKRRENNSVTLPGSPVDKLSSDDGLSNVQRLQLILSGLVNWTEQKVGRDNDPLMHKRSLEGLAYQIYPRGFSPKKSHVIAKFLADEDDESTADLVSAGDRLCDQQTQLRTVQANIKQLTLSDVQAGSLTTGVPKKLPAGGESLEQLKRLAEQYTQEITRLTRRRDALKNRIKATEIFHPSAGGINQQHEIHLPLVIAGGNAWANSYFLLTVSHALHVGVGLIGLAAMLLKRFEDGQPDNAADSGLEIVGLYWHFVTAVGIILSGLIYLV